MQTKLSASNCHAKLVIPSIATGYIPAKIIVDTKNSAWNLDLHIEPKYNPIILGTYIVNSKGKQVRVKDCVAYQGVWHEHPLIIVKTLGIGQNKHLIFIKCKINGKLIKNS